MPVKDPQTQDLLLTLYDWEQVGSHDKMGINVIHLKDLTPEEPKVLTVDILKNLNPDNIQNEKARGQLLLELNYKPFDEKNMPINFQGTRKVKKTPEGTPEGGGVLVVIIHEAQDLEGKHNCNPAANFHFKGERRRTKVNELFSSLKV